MTGSVEVFRNEDERYLSWVAAHDGGYVINIQHTLNPGDACVHHAACHTIRGRPARGSSWTGPYIKVCSDSRDELEAWVQTELGEPVPRCGICWRSGGSNAGSVPAPAAQLHSRAPTGAATIAASANTHYDFAGQEQGSRDVRLRAETYIPFERLHPWQLAARQELRQRLRSLAAAPGEILHASYAGHKPNNMDIENLVLYNIEGGGCFLPSVQHGLRFELAAGSIAKTSATSRYPCAYRYRLIPADSELDQWHKVRRLVTFMDVDLGQFRAVKRLEQTWLALHRSNTTIVESSITPGEPFGVFLSLKAPPGGRGIPRAELVKSLIDGVVAAFQAQRDPVTDEVAERLGRTMREEPVRIAEMLRDRRCASLGVVDHLVRKRGAGVQWNPSDHMCVVGQVLRDEAEGHDWRLSGEVWSLEPVEV